MTENNLQTADASTRPMVIKVVGRESNQEQNFEVSDASCIIGSSEKATIQVEDSNVESFHCEIVRYESGVYVRQLIEKIQVNGQQLAEAWLHPGDQIAMGGVQCEIVDPGQVKTVSESSPPFVAEPTPAQNPAPMRTDAPPTAPASVADVPSSCGCSQPCSCSEEACQQNCENSCTSPADDSQIEYTAAAAIADAEIASKAQMIAELQDRIQQEQEVEAAAPVVELPATPVTDTPAVDTPAVDTPTTEDEVSQFSQQAPEKLSPIWSDDSTKNEQARWLDQLYDSAVDDEQVNPSAEQPLDDRWGADSIAPDLMKPGVDPAQFSHLPQPSAAEANRVFDQVEGVAAPNQPESEAPVDASPENLIETPAEPVVPDVASVLRRLQAEQTEQPPVNAQPVQAEPPQPEAEQNESVADVLARMKDAGAIEQPLPGEANFAAEAVAQPSDPALAAAMRGAAEESAATATGQPANSQLPVPVERRSKSRGDESVQDYMNQLMHRLRGDEQPPAQGPIVTPSAETGVVAPEPVVEPVAENLVPQNPMTASEFVPRNVNREKTSTLDALRQVANQSVETAIRKSAKAKSSETSLIYLCSSGACLFLSAVLLILSNGVFDFSFILAILFAVGCVAAGFMYVSLNSTNVSNSKSNDAGPPAENGNAEVVDPNQQQQ